MDMYFAKQAVYKENLGIYAYDLLFDNNSNVSMYNKKLIEKRIEKICDIGTVGINKFTSNKKAFIRCTNLALLEEIPNLLGSENIIIEIDNNIEVNELIEKAIENYKNNGFTICYDYNYETVNNAIEKIIKYIDIIRIDVSKDVSEVKEVINKFKILNSNVKFLANNILNEEKYEEAVNLGFSYFSGKYFSMPTVIKDKEICIRNENRYNIIIELLNDDFDIERVESIIKSDLSISYKLIRFLNSPVFGFVQDINSIRQAIMLLGKEELRKWLTLIIVSNMESGNNEEKVRNTIIRGRFCELVAEKSFPMKKSKSFIVGLFSELNFFVEEDMESILGKIKLDSEVKAALLGEENILKTILDLVKAYEKMDVKMIVDLSAKLNINKTDLFELYSESIDWINEIDTNINKK